MPDLHDRNEKSDNASAQERERAALERGVAEIKTPDQARRSLDSLEKAAGDLREEDVASAMSSSPEQQAAAVEEAGDVPAAAKPASVIAAAAVQSANAAPGEKQIVDEAVTQALGGRRRGIRRAALGHAWRPPPLAPGTVSAARSAAGSGCRRFRTDQPASAHAAVGSLHDSPELGDDGWHLLAAVPAARNARRSSARLENNASRGACPLVGHHDR